MRGAALVVLVALAAGSACGGKVAPKKDAQSRFEKDLAEMKGWADRACACRDRGCAMKVDLDLEKEARAWAEKERAGENAESSVGDEEQDKQFAAELVRMMKCIQKHGAAPQAMGVIVRVKFEEQRDRACACEDYACLVAVAEEWDRLLATLGHVPGSQQTRDEMTAVNAEAQACFARGPEMRMQEAVLDMKALRKRACECADVACADTVQRDFDAFLETYKDVPGTQTVAEQIGEAAGAMAKCLADARAGQPAAE
jgi:hypothetical protein